MKRNVLFRWIVAVLAVLALYTGFGVWGVPALIRSLLPEKASEALGREVRLEAAYCNPFTLALRLEGLSIAGRESEPDLLSLKEVAVNLQSSSVFRGHLELHSVRVDGLRVEAGIDADGGLSVQDILDRLAALAAAASEPEKEVAEPEELLGLRIRDFSLSDAQITAFDAALKHPFRETYVISEFQGHDIGTVAKDNLDDGANAPAYHWVFSVESNFERGGSILFSGGAVSLDPWAFRLESFVTDLPLPLALPHLRESVLIDLAGLFSSSATLDVSLGGDVPQVVFVADAHVKGLVASDADGSFVEWDSLDLGRLEAVFPNPKVTLRDLVVTAPSLFARRLADGSLRMPQFVEAVPAEGPASPTADEPSSAAVDFGPIQFELKDVAILQGQLSYVDESLPSPFAEKIENLAFTLSRLEGSLAGTDLSLGLDALWSMDLLGGSTDGELALEGLDGKASVSVNWKDLDISRGQAFVEPLANVLLQSGRVSGTLGAELDVPAQALSSARLDAQLADLGVDETVQGTPLLRLGSAAVVGASFREDVIDIEAVEIKSPSLVVVNDAAGGNLARIAKAAAEESPAAAEAAAPESALPSAEAQPLDLPFALNLKRLSVEDGRFDVSDETLVRPYRTTISGYNLQVSNVSTDPAQKATVEMGAVIDAGARYAVKGSLLPLDIEKDTRLEISLDGYDLVAISPFWETYLGRKLAKGQMDFSAMVTIVDKFMDANQNATVIDQLTLGEKVESERAMRLPLGLAIGLLKDGKGVITVKKLGVEGDLTDPSVNPTGIVIKALLGLPLKVAAWQAPLADLMTWIRRFLLRDSLG